MILDLAHAHDLPAIAELELSFPQRRWSERAWADELASERSHVLVERDADRNVLGVATFSLAGDVVDLDRVVVAPDQRRHGIGRRLVLGGLEWAQEVKARQVMLEVDADNEPARALYESLGFVALGRRSNYYGAGHDALVMALPLEENHE